MVTAQTGNALLGVLGGALAAGLFNLILAYLVLQRNVANKITKKTKAWYVSPTTSQVGRRKYHAHRNYNQDSVY
jgi:hypothetical protein